MLFVTCHACLSLPYILGRVWVQFLSQTHGPKIPHENKYRINYIMHVVGIGYEGPSVGPILTLWEDE